MTILSPTAEDIGQWKCKVGSGDKIFGGFLRVTDSDSTSDSNEIHQITADDVFVKTENSFEVNIFLFN